MIFCTSICSNYIPKAKVLANSLKQYNPDAVFVLCLVERTVPSAANDPESFDLVVTADELDIGDFEGFMFRHSIVEASTAVKGHLFKELLRRFPQNQKFIYLDPDILVMGPFIELSEILETHSIVLTPHLCEPEDSLGAILDNEVCALKHGVFNLGFLAIRRSKEAEQFIEWWSSRLYEFCYADIPGGLFTDQRWIDLAPCFFDVFVFRNPGYNVAPWNLSRRHITQNDKGEYVVRNYPLRFFHFSGFDSGANEHMISKYCPDKKDPVYKIRQRYLELLEKFEQEELGKLPWSYDFYSNGERIKNSHRVMYRDSKELQMQFKEPFTIMSSPSFYRHIKRYTSSWPFKFWYISTSKGRLLYGYTKRAFQRGGVRLVVDRTVQYLKRRLS